MTQGELLQFGGAADTRAACPSPTDVLQQAMREGALTTESGARGAKSDYWDAYYAKLTVDGMEPPSQFAALVLGECDAPTVVDIGCGSGRDSLLFSRYGRRVTSIDASHTAVEQVHHLIRLTGLSGWEARQLDIAASATEPWSSYAAEVEDGGATAYYSRFVLHALDDAEESAFWQALCAQLRPGDWVAIETRVSEDQSRPKATPEHFRRFPAAESVVHRAQDSGLKVHYEYQGTGVAVWRGDDAHVLRLLLRST